MKPRESQADGSMPLLDHLDELRTRIFACLMTFVIGAVGGFFFGAPLIDALLIPIEQSGLVAPQTAPLQLEFDGEGSIRIRNAEALTAATEAARASESKRATPPPITRIELFQGDSEASLGVFETARRAGVVYLRPLDPFMVRLKMAVIFGLIIAMPMMIYQVYKFVAPGLYDKERKAIIPFLLAMPILFPLGAAFAYFMIQYALAFFARYAAGQAYMFNDIKAYMSLALNMMLAFGLLFQLPVAVLVLTRAGIVSPQFLSSKRRQIFIVILVVSAIATPPDPFTMLAMSVPLFLLFEISLTIARLAEKRSALSEQEAEPI